MSYAIGNIICGCDIDERLNEWVNEVGMDPEAIGFTSLYSGDSRLPPAYCGVVLCTIDECNNVPLASLKLFPTEAQREQARQCLQAAREKLLEAFAEDERILDGEEGLLGEEDKKELLASIPDNPSVMLVWSTS